MKTAIKITALAVAMALIAISCAVEPELTSRNWKQKTADEDTTKLSIGSGSVIPSVVDGPTSPAIRETQREVTLFFPEKADVLRTGNAAIVSKMKEFMQFYKYTKGADSDKPDTLGASVDYTFVDRIPGTNGEYITVRLASDPGEYLTIKIDANKYTYSSGRKLGGTNDPKPGTPYYDEYISCPVSGVAYKSPYDNPYQLATTLTIGLPDDPLITGASLETTVASLSFPSGNALTAAERNRVRDSFLPGLISKLKLKKYENGRWVDASGNFRYDSATYNAIRLTFNRVEFTPYRIEATGVNNLSVRYLGVDQPVTVRGSGEQTGGYNRSTVVSGVHRWTDPARIDRYFATPGNVGSLISGSEVVTVDKEGKNAVIRFWFSPLYAPSAPGTPVYLKLLDLATFKKNVKIVFRGGSTGAISNLNDTNDLCYIDVKEIAYTSSTSGSLDILTITLDPNFNIKTFSKPVYFLLSPGFEYNNSNIIFGNYGNWRYEIDGVKHFAAYGPVPFNSGAPSIPAPTGLAALVAPNNLSVNVTWNTAPGAATYDVYRRVGSGNFTRVAPNTSGTSYPDSDIYPGVTYSYYVVAVNSSGDESSPSSSVSASVPTGSPSGALPAAPTSVNAIAQSSSSISLTWTAPPSNAARYHIYRGTSSNVSASSQIAAGVIGTSYTDTNLNPNTPYYYWVAGVNSGNYAGDKSSSPASATTLPSGGGGGGINPPTGLYITATTSNSVSLSWNSVSGAAGYAIYRGTSSNVSFSNYIDAVMGSGNTTYTDTTVSPNSVYYYWVTAGDSSGNESNYSSSYAQANTPSGGGGGGFTPPASSLSLSPGVWTNGNITSLTPDGEDWYSFSVISGTYYVWWNDADNSYGMLDVRVAAYDANGEIFDEDNSDSNSESFNVTTPGTIYVKVYPLSEGGTGSYGITYTTTNSRP